MPFPAINYCIVCEGVRPEIGGKLSILGFFGVTPLVDIGVGRLDQLLSLSVVLGFGAVTNANEAYTHVIRILNPDGSVLFQTPPARVNTLPGKPGLLVASALAVPGRAGPRTIIVEVNGERRFEGQFMVRQATPQELAGLPGAPVH